MLKQLAAAALTLAIISPSAALADDSTSLTSPNQVSASDLGPQTSDSGGGSSNADSAALQPAGQNPLQSSTSDSTGLVAPSSALQAPSSSSDSLQVLSGEADGSPHQTGTTAPPLWVWLMVSLGVALVVTAGGIVWRDRRRFARAEV